MILWHNNRFGSQLWLKTHKSDVERSHLLSSSSTFEMSRLRAVMNVFLLLFPLIPLSTLIFTYFSFFYRLQVSVVQKTHFKLPTGDRKWLVRKGKIIAFFLTARMCVICMCYILVSEQIRNLNSKYICFTAVLLLLGTPPCHCPSISPRWSWLRCCVTAAPLRLWWRSCVSVPALWSRGSSWPSPSHTGGRNCWNSGRQFGVKTVLLLLNNNHCGHS